MALTKRQIDAAAFDPDGPAQQILYDGDIPGFGVRLYPSGAKSFVLRYRNPSGRDRFLTIGKYGVFTLQQARERAKLALLKMTDGSDPAEERRSARQGITMREFAAIYIRDHAKRRKKTWQADQANLDTHILPALGSYKLKEIERDHVRALHLKIGETAPYAANRILALLSVMINLAVDWGYLDEETPNPTRRIKRFKEQARDRFLQPAEVAEVLSAISREPNIYIRAVLLLYLLTGARKSELLRAQWWQVDLSSKIIRFAETKGGRPHRVPLSTAALSVLHELPREMDNPYVFPGRRKGRPLVNIAKAWNRVRREAKVEDVRLHDLRRTVGSWIASDGRSLQIIAQILNHSNLSTTQIYARLMEGPTRQALEEHGNRILQVGRIASPQDPQLNADRPLPHPGPEDTARRDADGGE